MHRTLLHLCFFVTFLLILAACTDKGEAEAESTEASGPSAAETPLVSLHAATTGSLPLRRRANGKLRARREVVVKSRAGGLVDFAPMEGAYYKKGSTLLQTDVASLELARQRAAALRDEANFRHDDLLLRLSTHLPPGDTVTELARRNILIQSGLPTAEVALKEAEFQLGLATLTAPFGGRTADVVVQPGQQITAGETICTLIDPNSLEVEFSMLENELGDLGRRQSVSVSPVAEPGRQVAAALDVVNPRVEDGGLLRVRARLKGANTKGLYPGMNVVVTLERRSPEVVLLPKAAIVSRSGRDLVFTYAEDEQRAKWQYVTVSYENDQQVGVSEGVEAGQAVIVTGNLTLDHDSRVRLE